MNTSLITTLENSMSMLKRQSNKHYKDRENNKTKFLSLRQASQMLLAT